MSPRCFHEFIQLSVCVMGGGDAKAELPADKAGGAPVEYPGVFATLDMYWA